MSSERVPTKFRNAFNQRWTRQLFRDVMVDRPVEETIVDPLYTLHHDWTPPGASTPLPCFRKLYVQLGDPTGFQLATRYLEDYDHWRLLLKAGWFRAAKELWDEELDAKLASEGLATIRSFADGIEGVSPAVTLTAARYLADKAYRSKADKPARGRPTKAEVAGALAQETANASDIAGDLARIRLVKS